MRQKSQCRDRLPTNKNLITNLSLFNIDVDIFMVGSQKPYVPIKKYLIQSESTVFRCAVYSIIFYGIRTRALGVPIFMQLFILYILTIILSIHLNLCLHKHYAAYKIFMIIYFKIEARPISGRQNRNIDFLGEYFIILALDYFNIQNVQLFNSSC